MQKPTVYLDTNIFSAYWYEGHDVAAAARRFHTREWWAFERRHFALRISVTTINELDINYLLTWNYAHLANPLAQERLEAICHEFKLRAPLLVSPETIPHVRFGQSVRRSK